MNSELLSKYNVPGPRYTSYPTVPLWDTVPVQPATWQSLVKQTFGATNATSGISLYIHLPFCEKLCTYCGCNTRITVNHAVERVYMEALRKEWQLYLGFLPAKPRVQEIHLGGGTPTFFSPDNLKALVSSVLETSDTAAGHAFGFEAHPGNTTPAHLKALSEAGFSRISIGVQDFDPEVLAIINRFQTYDQVKKLTEDARAMGYHSINYDLVYGLPLQRSRSFAATVERVVALRPDRIALYSYAHVPWVKPGQRKFSEADLPAPEQKLELYRIACDRLAAAGYVNIGMDHFALPADPLCRASANKTLHRNFMGYTTQPAGLLIGLGASAISDSGSAYVQNEKKLETYYARLRENRLPFFKGHVLTREDVILRQHIRQLMCHFETSWSEEALRTEAVYEALGRLRELEADGLVRIAPYRLEVTGKGKPFVRTVCRAFDARLYAGKDAPVMFSQTV